MRPRLHRQPEQRTVAIAVDINKLWLHTELQPDNRGEFIHIFNDLFLVLHVASAEAS
jgi:hypothetical protein